MFLGFFFVGNAFLCKITSFHLEVPRPGEFESVTSKIFSLSHTFLQINKTTYLNNKKI